MESKSITEDYYMILEVEPTATLDLITRSYKRLALKTHPDRNSRHDATAAFQLLGRAYEILKDETKRRLYDISYPSIIRNRAHSQTPRTSRPYPASNAQQEVPSEAAKITALQNSKLERSAMWQTSKNAFDSSIFELQRDIRRVQQEIKNLNSIVAAEAAELAQKNSWSTWLWSSVTNTAEESEEEKNRKDRGRQERKLEKDMKERRLHSKNAALERVETQLRKAKEEIDAANLACDIKIQALRHVIAARELKEMREKERVAREEYMRIQKRQQEEREKRQREAADAYRKQQEEAEKRQREAADAYRKQQVELGKRQREVMEALMKQEAEADAAWLRQQGTESERNRECDHHGWWPKVQGRRSCTECSEVWTYMLQCPSCKMKACPKCQAQIRKQRSSQRAYGLYDRWS